MSHADDIRKRAETARALARQVGQQALQALAKGSPLELDMTLKGPQDFVTAVDRMTEDRLCQALAQAFPEDGFFGEETGGTIDTGALWVVDPIDGTANFMRALPEWCVSMAYVANGRVEIGIVHDAPFNVTYWAVAGGGAYADDRPIPETPGTPLEQSIVMLGRSNRTEFGDYIKMITALQQAGADHRRFGSAALGLVRAAQGAVDAYYEASLNAWDALAGALIAREAGCELRAPDLDDFLKTPGPVLAARGPVSGIILDTAPPQVLARLIRQG